MAERTVLFDGVCNLCNGAVRFIIKRDPHAHFRFASLQSDIGQGLLQEHNIPLDVKTIVLIVADADRGSRAYDRSSAALHIARGMHRGWPLFFGFMIIPRFIRDGVYNFIARNRYKWFGRRDECMLPTPEMAGRFIPES